MRRLVSIALLLGLASPLNGWFNGGHMTVAYIAYQNLTKTTRSKVDALLKLNPLYSTWVAGVSKKQKGLTAFLQAATWPDCIKRASCAAGYTSDGGDIPPGNPSDAQNIGYSDMLMHRYWHFVDIPDSAGAPGLPPKIPNAQTEIELLSQAISTKEAKNIKSYDVAWLEHLIGDVHQPLHATSRFTVNHPQGDAGGNFVPFCALPCHDELHAYWDGLLGDTLTVAQVITQAQALMAAGQPAGASVLTPATWVNDSFALAKSAVYIAPIIDDNNPAVKISPRPDSTYDANAHAVANAQVLLAGYRLAGILNANLK